jgi:flagellar basal-body rod protein FlgB
MGAAKIASCRSRVNPSRRLRRCGDRTGNPANRRRREWIWGRFMSMTDLPVLRALREKLKFHEQRQKVLADNVANASTPGYVGRDMKAPDFFRVAAEMRSDPNVPLKETDRLHIEGRAISNRGAFGEQKLPGYEVTPDGNAIVLEEQMMKVTDNQMDYQIATTLYQRSLGLLKTAIGKR